MSCNKYVVGISNPCVTCIEPCEERIESYIKQINQDLESSFKNMLEYRKENNMETQWKTPEDVMKWFIGESDKKREEIEGQCSMF